MEIFGRRNREEEVASAVPQTIGPRGLLSRSRLKIGETENSVWIGKEEEEEEKGEERRRETSNTSITSC